MWISNEEMLHSHIAETPTAVAFSKGAVSGGAVLAPYLSRLWQVHQLDLVARVVLLVDCDDAPQYVCYAHRFGLAQRSAAKIVLDSMSLFTTVLHGTTGGTIVLDLGHRTTRLVPIVDGMVVVERVQLIGGMDLLLQSGTHRELDEAVDRYMMDENGEKEGTSTAINLRLSVYVEALEVALRQLSRDLKKSGNSSCLEYITLMGGGADSSLRLLVSCVIADTIPRATIAWS